MRGQRTLPFPGCRSWAAHHLGTWLGKTHSSPALYIEGHFPPWFSNPPSLQTTKFQQKHMALCLNSQLEINIFAFRPLRREYKREEKKKRGKSVTMKRFCPNTFPYSGLYPFQADILGLNLSNLLVERCHLQQNNSGLCPRATLDPHSVSAFSNKGRPEGAVQRTLLWKSRDQTWTPLCHHSLWNLRKIPPFSGVLSSLPITGEIHSFNEYLLRVHSSLSSVSRGSRDQSHQGPQCPVG